MYEPIMQDFISFSIQNKTEFKHYGVGHLDGGHSGRYPWLSGVRPGQRDPKVQAEIKKAKNASSGVSKEKSNVTKVTKEVKLINQGLKLRDRDSEQQKAFYDKRDKLAHVFGGFAFDKSSKRLKQDDERRQLLTKDKESGFYLKSDTEMGLSREEQIAIDAERSNPLYSEYRHGYTHNCALCSMTYDMRRRGYDVRAKELHNGFSVGDTGKAFYDKSLDTHYVMYRHNATISPSKKEINEAVSNLNKFPKNSYGLITVDYLDTVGGGGHAMVFDRINGKTIITCPQSNSKWDLSNEKECKSCFSLLQGMHAYRTDNRTPNLQRMHEVCE